MLVMQRHGRWYTVKCPSFRVYFDTPDRAWDVTLELEIHECRHQVAKC